MRTIVFTGKYFYSLNQQIFDAFSPGRMGKFLPLLCPVRMHPVPTRVQKTLSMSGAHVEIFEKIFSKLLRTVYTVHFPQGSEQNFHAALPLKPQGKNGVGTAIAAGGRAGNFQIQDFQIHFPVYL